uniref:Uncharacterized protein n=1 Tax=Oryza barthii TaxID=65489 RepID=A0A0D3FSY3_9ORYZ
MVVFYTYRVKLTGEIWEVYIYCKGDKERVVKARVDKDLYDDYREQTIKTYTEWLREQGHMKQINGKQDGRGTLKGLAALAKRLKSSSRKIKVEFSAKLGGPCGDNRHTFVDEVVMFTRLQTPLIGVRKWKDVKQDVNNSIADCVMKVSTQNSTNRQQMKIMHLMAWKLALTDSDEPGDEGSRSVTFGGGGVKKTMFSRTHTRKQQEQNQPRYMAMDTLGNQQKTNFRR